MVPAFGLAYHYAYLSSIKFVDLHCICSSLLSFSCFHRHRHRHPRILPSPFSSPSRYPSISIAQHLSRLYEYCLSIAICLPLSPSHNIYHDYTSAVFLSPSVSLYPHRTISITNRNCSYIVLYTRVVSYSICYLEPSY